MLTFLTVLYRFGGDWPRHVKFWLNRRRHPTRWRGTASLESKIFSGCSNLAKRSSFSTITPGTMGYFHSHILALIFQYGTKLAVLSPVIKSCSTVPTQLRIRFLGRHSWKHCTRSRQFRNCRTRATGIGLNMNILDLLIEIDFLILKSFDAVDERFAFLNRVVESFAKFLRLLRRELL